MRSLKDFIVATSCKIFSKNYVDFSQIWLIVDIVGRNIFPLCFILVDWVIAIDHSISSKSNNNGANSGGFLQW